MIQTLSERDLKCHLSGLFFGKTVLADGDASHVLALANSCLISSTLAGDIKQLFRLKVPISGNVYDELKRRVNEPLGLLPTKTVESEDEPDWEETTRYYKP